ncbi:T9SS type A sorting domain-containing protein [bacterium]|nr:T9SS type A sorting domain-containing protein [bacterium]
MRSFHRWITVLCFFSALSLFSHVKDGVWQIPQAAYPPVIDGKMDDLYKCASTERVIRQDREDAASPDSYLDLFAEARLMWDETYLYVFVKVVDDEISSSSSNSYENDSVEYFFDGDNSKVIEAFDGVDDVQVRIEYQDTDPSGVNECPEGTEFAVADWENLEGLAFGYAIEAAFPLASVNIEASAGTVFGWEIQINDRDNGMRENMFRWWGESNDAWHMANLWGEAELNFFEADDVLHSEWQAPDPEIDGILDDDWFDYAPAIESGTYVFSNCDVPGCTYTEILDWEDLQMEFRVMHNYDALYLWVEVIDDEISISSPNWWENDCIELFFDGGNEKNRQWDDNDMWLHYTWTGDSDGTENNEYAWGRLDSLEGYTFELKIPRQDLPFGLGGDEVVGFELHVNDRDHEKRENIIRWWSSNIMSWNDPSLFGTLVFYTGCPPDPFNFKYISIFEPDGGETFAAGDTLKFSWDSNYVHSIDIFISFNNGLDWEQVGTALPAFGDCIMIVPDRTTNECLVKFVDHDDPSFQQSVTTPITIVTSVNGPEGPRAFGLGPNYPNPFNPSTTVSYTLDRSGPARLTVTDLLGREVAVIDEGFKFPGSYKTRFNASGLESGMYFVRLESGAGVKTGKIILLK